MGVITIPFKPRIYQEALNEYILEGGLRAFVEWHRRAGKDLDMWNLMFRKSQERVGLYYYFLPTATQGRKIIWDGMTIDGLRFLGFIPKLIKVKENSTEMKLTLANGSIMQVIGTDRFDSIRGTNPIGCVFSEYAYQNPMAWDVIRPILKVNKGWACFNTTPNGENHSHDLGEMAKKNPKWFHQVLTIDDTGVLNDDDMNEERAEGMSEAAIQREYYCSHNTDGLGTIYTKQIKEAEGQGRIGLFPWIKGLPVQLALDLGKSDSTTIVMWQYYQGQIRIIAYYENNGEDIAHYAEVLRGKDYQYGTMFLPHDAYAKRLDSRKTIAEQFRDLGFNVPNECVPKMGVENGIQEVRKAFPQMVFNEETTIELLRALKFYHYEYDVARKSLKATPEHDWSSHAADSLRYMALSLSKQVIEASYDYDAILKQIM